jgi:hypothetical protein
MDIGQVENKSQAMKTIRIDKPTLVKYMYLTLNRVKYKYGAKAVLLGTKPENIDYIDCSGFTRWLLYMCSGQRIPDGSWNQRKFGFRIRDIKLILIGQLQDAKIIVSE